MSDPADSVELTIEIQRHGRIGPPFQGGLQVMCVPGQLPAAPATAADAAAMARAALAWLATADIASLTTAEQADCLRALEQTTSMHTAAQARVLAGFCARGGHEDDRHGSARTWLKWQTQI